MKQFFKTFTLLLCIAVGFASCNETEEADTKNVTYPEHIQLGTWESEHTLLSNSYVAELAINLKGDTVLNFTKIDTATNEHIYMTSTECSYDSKTGMVTAFFKNSFLEAPTRAYLALRKDNVNATVQMFEMQGDNLSLKERFIAKRINKVMLYKSSWQTTAATEGADPTSIILFNSETIDDKDVRVDFTLGEEYYIGTYTWDAATGKGTVDCQKCEAGAGTLVGKTLPLSLNEKNQLVMQAGEQTLVYERSK
ncbi:hypothetical protein, secreted [gut metagenome]|uniref:Lipocalin-like domain-containing protein n=1 Tax=gut metagenome TaxID=749906 RepID=J9FZ02_9ZZZZ